MEAFFTNIDKVIDGFSWTVRFALFSALFSFILGVILTAMRVSPRLLRGVSTAYVEVRNSPHPGTALLRPGLQQRPRVEPCGQRGLTCSAGGDRPVRLHGVLARNPAPGINTHPRYAIALIKNTTVASVAAGSASKKIRR